MSYTVCFTGHRPKDLGGYDKGNPTMVWVRDALMGTVKELLEDGANRFISGMALGVDQEAAQAVILARPQVKPPTVKLVAAVPCDGQERTWPTASQSEYQALLRQVDEVKVVCPGPYAPWKMQARNEWMVDNSDLVVAVWTGKATGGTANCVRYAREQGRRLLFLNPQDQSVRGEGFPI